ncbi:perlwapin-like protein [Tupaia chinensis]|uniref:perlwapin-like protein n=1 Tax=Tupaia chinensis TaxID=246437 RepID=UPI0007041C1C|nr:perlwapin-like protein [Tupaia chinensis]
MLFFFLLATLLAVSTAQKKAPVVQETGVSQDQNPEGQDVRPGTCPEIWETPAKQPKGRPNKSPAQPRPLLGKGNTNQQSKHLMCSEDPCTTDNDCVFPMKCCPSTRCGPRCTHGLMIDPGFFN